MPNRLLAVSICVQILLTTFQNRVISRYISCKSPNYQVISCWPIRTRRIRKSKSIDGDLKHGLVTFLRSVLLFRNDLGVDLTHGVYLRPIPKRSRFYWYLFFQQSHIPNCKRDVKNTTSCWRRDRKLSRQKQVFIISTLHRLWMETRISWHKQGTNAVSWLWQERRISPHISKVHQNQSFSLCCLYNYLL